MRKEECARKSADMDAAVQAGAPTASLSMCSVDSKQDLISTTDSRALRSKRPPRRAAAAAAMQQQQHAAYGSPAGPRGSQSAAAEQQVRVPTANAHHNTHSLVCSIALCGMPEAGAAFGQQCMRMCQWYSVAS
jgi:hypothetical protein